jgi:Fe-S oxidoreductase
VAEQGRIAGPGGEVVLFQTCYVQNNEPQIGLDTLEVLDQNGIDSRCAQGLTCCGMPAWEKGDLDRLRSLAHQNLAILHPYVKAGAKVVAINPTCSMMLRREYPSLLEGRDRELATEVAGAVRDPSEMLWSIRKEERFNTTVQSRPNGGFAYHAPCHLRAQAVGFKGRDLIRKILGVRPETVLECCGHDGTWAMTTEGFEASQRAGKKSFDGMKATGAEVWITDCPLASLQFEQHAGKTPLHPMTLLARAYRGDPL